MVKILMKTTIAGPNVTVSAGQMVCLPPEQAMALVDGGYATAVVDKKPETATAEKREKAVLPPVAKRKK
jgi:hypothetical protein